MGGRDHTHDERELIGKPIRTIEIMFAEKERELKWKMVLGDIAIAITALAAACSLRLLLPGGREIDPFAHFSLLPMFLILLMPSLSYHGAYLNPIRASIWDLIGSIAVGISIAFGGLLALMFAMKIQFFSRAVLALFSLFLFGGIILVRGFVIWRLNRAFQHEGGLYRVIIVGTGNRAKHLVASLQKGLTRGIDIVGFLDPYSTRANCGVPEARILGSTSEFRSILKSHVIDEVILAITRNMHDDVEDIVRACEEEGIKLRMMADFHDMRISRMSLTMVAGTPLLLLEPVAIDEGRMVVKRMLDFILSAVGIILLFPLMVVIAAAIKIDSKGPVFFTQERVGFHKRIFRMYKFRSMYDGSHNLIQELEKFNEASGPIFKMHNDPRITRIGKFLRQSSLDELPQLFNILKGDMSLVGPRPMSVRDVNLFDQGIQRKRFSVRPGLTCLWQISGRSNLPFSKWLELDLQYIDNWTLFLDLKILFKTIPAVITGNGAQ